MTRIQRGLDTPRMPSVAETTETSQATPLANVEAPAEDAFTNGQATSQVAIDRTKVGHTSAVAETTDRSLSATISSERARFGRGAGANDAGKGLNSSTAGQSLRSASGRIPNGDWDHPERIVGKLTQYPARGALSAGNAQDRCAPSNLLGAAIMAGPAQGQRFLEGVSSSSRLSGAEQRELQTIATAVGNRTATFEQLSRAQGLLYKAGNTRGDLGLAMDRALLSSSPLNRQERAKVQALQQRVVVQGGGMTQLEANELSRLLTKGHGGSRVDVQLLDDPHHPGDASRQFWGVSVANDRSGYDDAELNGLVSSGRNTTRPVTIDNTVATPFVDVLGRINAGESITLRVSGTDDGFDADHFITLGKRSDGTPYVYNPDPAQGDFTLYTGSASGRQPQGFLDQLTKYEGRISFDNDGDQPQALATRWAN